jgi:3'-phosphoadenosine 5'-phosphosulfate sulfotransferase (PAPS reductase)/FAD synthetase
MIDVSYELRLIEDFVAANDGKIYCATSGGKDSAVIMHLTHQVFPGCLFIHNPKSETDPRTVQMLYEYSMKYHILYCRGADMQTLITSGGFEGQIDGTKRCEWNRSDKSIDVIIDGKNVRRDEMNAAWVVNGIWGIQNLYPILEWSDEKVFEFCRENSIPLSKEYE